MKKLKELIFFILLTTMSNSIAGQQFLAKLKFIDFLNNSDSITIGYDPNATEGIDGSFGEVDIQSTPLNNILDVRICNEIANGCGIQPLTYSYMTKKQIIKSSCGFYDSINFSIHSILIKCKNYPITVKWDSIPFNTNCDNVDLITDYFPGGWFDAPCSNSKILEYFYSNSSFVLNKNPYPYPQYGVKGNDSLYILYYATYPADPVNIQKIATSERIIQIYPNPGNGLFHVSIENPEQTQFTAHLSDISSREIRSFNLNGWEKDQEFDISELNSGIYLLTITRDKSLIYSTKLVKQE